ncbi:hypothetical protein HKD37_05G012659 [Glycine soja]
MGGQGGATTANAYELHCVQVQSGPFFPPYGLPLNYTLLTTVYVPGEKIASFAPVFIENQQPQPNHTHAHASQPMEETHEAPQDNNLNGFGVYPGHTTKGQAFFDVPVLNALGAPQYRPPSQPLHFYEKIVGYMPSSFADLVFVGERIEVGRRKGKFNYVAFMNPGNRGPEMSGERKKKGKSHVVAVVPTWPNFSQAPYNPMYQYLTQQCHYSANINPAHYPPPYQPRAPNQPQRSPLNRPQNPSIAQPRPNTTPNTDQSTNQGRNFLEKKPVEFTPILISYVDLLPYLLNNTMQ